MARSEESRMNTTEINIEQLATFYIGDELFGIEVMKVQEVTGPPQVAPIPLAPDFVRGLVNLRGQIATAIGLNELFSQKKGEHDNSEMSVVCHSEGTLISLIVDEIGDVLEVSNDQYEKAPDTLPANLKRFIKGVYKLDDTILSVIDIETIFKELSPINETAQGRNYE